MDREILLNELKTKTELQPDSHDGSYELVREVINSYATLDNFDAITYADLDAVYLMAIITKRINPEKKKEKIKNTCLSEEEKNRMIQIIDKVWDNACLGTFYSNKEDSGTPIVGMFGTGFFSFKGKTTDECARSFIEMCVEISKEEDAEIIYSKASNVVNSSFKGMKAASVSVVLHCLKPNVFPIINGNQGMGSVFSMLGIELNKPSEIGTYIENSRKINEFRNSEFTFKNYRIFDLVARDIFGKEMDDIEEEDSEEIADSNIGFDHNLILYGPPGTGKTYNTVIYAVAIIEGKEISAVEEEAKLNYDEVKARYLEYKSLGQITFTTFHQSYGYEEFIEGIKPETDNDTKDIRYSIKDGVFKAFCIEAEKPTINSSTFQLGEDPRIWKVTIKDGGDNEVKKECFQNGHVRIGFSRNDDVGHVFTDEIIKGDIVVSLKTRKTIDAIGVIASDDAYNLGGAESYELCRDIQWLATNLDYDICEINEGKMLNRPTVCGVPSMKVEDIISVAKKHNESLNGTDVEKNNKPYVFIIDEINRGNISKIFGELITLIETTKRKGMPEETKVTLPYSSLEFGVPSNIYILGTMNTADRSIALMDTALRRRFSFVEMMPKTDVLKNLGIQEIKIGNRTLDVPRMLDVINKRIEFLFDREHTIGHAFFTGLKTDPSINKLANIFKKNVIPLLQEYFYEDYEKIQLVLGDNKKSQEEYKFILKREESASSIFNGNPELDAMDTYIINMDAFEYLESYIEIYELTGVKEN